MTATMQIQGTEVIGCPGQNLTERELFLLVSLAEGIPTPVIAQRLNIDAVGMRQAEVSILGKLAAKNKVHMITRGFTLGVLIPQALCLLLCILSAVEVEQDFTRPKSQRRTRSLTENTRSFRFAPAHGGAAPGRATLYV